MEALPIMTTTTASKGRKATTTAPKATPPKGRTTHAWTLGVPAAIVDKMRATAHAAGVTTDTLADLASMEATLEGMADLQGKADTLAPAVWAFVAASFGGRLPAAGRMPKADSTVLADLKAGLMGKGMSDDAARKAIVRARWAGILQAHPAMKGQPVAAIRTMAADADAARTTVTTGERAGRKVRTTAGPKAGKAGKAGKGSTGSTTTPPAAPVANLSDVVKVSDASTTANLLKALDAMLKGIDKRNLTGSEREAFLAMMASHGFAPALTAAANG
jgi:hypothetical protein